MSASRAFASLLVVVLCWSAGPCGSETCRDFQCKTHPSCTIDNVRSNECLATYLKTIHEKVNMKKVILENINISSGLAPRMFENVQYETLIFKNTRIGSLSNSAVSPFLGASSIRKLYFLQTMNRLNKWQFSHLAVLQLTHLVFSKAANGAFNNHNQLPDTFNGAATDSVLHLEVSACCLNQINSRSMTNFTNVETISLVGNSIHHIEPNAFPRNLRFIDLSANCLKTLSSDAFRNLPGLRQLNLQMNILHTVPEDAIPKSVQNFYLNGNQVLICDHSLLWLLYVDKSAWLSDLQDDLPMCNDPCTRGCPLSRLIPEDISNNNCSVDVSKCRSGWKPDGQAMCLAR